MPRSEIHTSVADELLGKGTISQDDHRRAVDLASSEERPVEETLIELGLVTESDLLELLAKRHGVRHATTERVRSSKIEPAAIAKVPRSDAEALGLCAVKYDPAAERLMVLTADPSDTASVDKLKKLSGVEDVQLVVVRPGALKEALARGYDAAAQAPSGSTKRAELSSTLRSKDPAAELAASLAELQGPDESDRPAGRSSAPPSQGKRGKSSGPPSQGKRGKSSGPPSQGKRGKSSGPPSQGKRGKSSRPPSEGKRRPASAPAALVAGLDEIAITNAPVRPARLTLGPLARSHRPGGDLSSDERLVETLRVFVGLLESDRQQLRGHSAFVARLTQDACQRVGMSAADTNATVVAAYLHDIGKAEAPSSRGPRRAASAASHLTALNVAKFRVFRQLARELISVPEQLLESVGLAAATKDALRTMYERPDGKGIPKGLDGHQIPMAGRILAVADTYADLTRNAHNTYDKLLSAEEAMKVLSDHAGKVFDADVVEVFGQAMAGEKILTELLDERHRALLVDPDVEQTLMLQLRLSDEGMEVHTARSSREARAALKARTYALVVCEVDLERPDAGLRLAEAMASDSSSPDATWVFFARRRNKTLVRKAFRAGAQDFIAKPASADIVVAKLVALSERRDLAVEDAPPPTSRGVAGALTDMAVTDVVQILWHGQRTGALHLEWPDKAGEIHFKGGRIVHAKFADADGTTALYRLLELGTKREEGHFRVDPTFVPSGDETIDASTEALLLEAMRLIDEGIVP